MRIKILYFKNISQKSIEYKGMEKYGYYILTIPINSFEYARLKIDRK
jgi:hypothetical protein